MNRKQSDRVVRALRQVFARVCPRYILEHVVDQTLVDLVADRAAAARRLQRVAITAHGVTRLVLALALTLITFRQHWQQSEFGRVLADMREALLWLVFLTLLLILRVGLGRPEWARLDTLSPIFVLLSLIPIALPCAALSAVTIGRRPTIGRVIDRCGVRDSLGAAETPATLRPFRP
jgi:hypothetical protein